MLSDVSLRSPRKVQEANVLTVFGGLAAKIAQNKKRTSAFALLLVVASLLLGGLSFFSASFFVFLAQMAGFFALGHLHSLILQANTAKFTGAEKFLYSILLGGLAILALILLFYFKGSSAWLFVLACGCIFLLPYTVREAARLYSNVSAVTAATWRYDAALPPQKSTTFLNSIPVRFRIETDSLGEEERRVSFRAPVRMKLGTIFYHTVQEQNTKTEDPVYLSDPSGEPYEWTFSVASFGSTRYLNPELGLIENDVKPNAEIVARRLKTEID